MISLKQHIDGWVGHRDQTDFVEGPQPRLPELPAAPAVVTNENTNGKTMPAEWVEQALQHLATHEVEMKKLVVVMTKAARSVNERDERYALQVSDISQRLRSIAHFKDLSRISQMLVNDASSLTACVERIAREGRESLRRLTAELESYRLDFENREGGFSNPGPACAAADTPDDPNRRSAVEQWTTRAALRLDANRRELKEFVEAIGRALEADAGRVDRYSSEFIGIAQRLQSIARLKELDRIRHAIVYSAALITECLDRIAQEGRDSLIRVTSEVEEYRSRLASAERQSSLGLLTDFGNRRLFERQLGIRLKAGVRFCLILIALKEPKRVNNPLGQIANKELSCRIACELRAEFPAAELVMPCGRGEFAVIVTMSFRDAEARVRRIRRAAADHQLERSEEYGTTGFDADMDVVEWNGKEDSLEMLARNAVKFSEC